MKIEINIKIEIQKIGNKLYIQFFKWKKCINIQFLCLHKFKNIDYPFMIYNQKGNTKTDGGFDVSKIKFRYEKTLYCEKCGMTKDI